MIIAEEQVETMLFDSMWPTRGSRQFQHGIISLSRRSSALAKLWRMMLKPERCWSYGSCSQVLPKLSTNDYFQSRCIKGRGKVVACNRLYSSHMLIMSLSNLQVPRLKQWQHLSRSMAMRRWDHRLSAWNQKVFFGKPATRWKPHNNKQTREKSQVVMKGIQLPVVSNNTTGQTSRQQRWQHICPRLDFTKRIGPMSLFGLYLRHPFWS
jgi:hypothetical protein